MKLHLDWTFPGNASDFLDGSCLLLEQDACTGIVDYRGGDRGKKKVPKEAVQLRRKLKNEMNDAY